MAFFANQRGTEKTVEKKKFQSFQSHNCDCFILLGGNFFSCPDMKQTIHGTKNKRALPLDITLEIITFVWNEPWVFEMLHKCQNRQHDFWWRALGCRLTSKEIKDLETVWQDPIKSMHVAIHIESPVLMDHFVLQGVDLHDDTFFALAINMKKETSVKYLLTHKVDPFSTWENSALYLTSKTGDPSILPLLREHRYNFDDFNDNKALGVASEKGYLDIVLFILQERVSYLQDRSDYALLRASAGGQLHVVKVLIEEYKANVNWFLTPLVSACVGGHVTTAQYLMEHKAHLCNVTGAALKAAIGFGHLDLVKLLIQHKAHVDQSFECLPLHEDMNTSCCYHQYIHPILTASSCGQLDMVKYLVQQQKTDMLLYGEEALIQASACGHIDVVDFLLECKVNVEAHNNEALVHACRGGHLGMVKFLLDCKADLHTQEDRPLMNACANGYKMVMVEWLLRKNANVHAQDNKALLDACASNSLAMVQLLIKFKANVHAQDNKALLDACATNSLNMVQLLIEFNANVQSSKRNPLYNAVRPGSYALVKLLIQHKADVQKHANHLLYSAVESKELDIVKLLLRHNASMLPGFRENLILKAQQDLQHDIVRCLRKVKRTKNNKKKKEYLFYKPATPSLTPMYVDFL